MSAKHYEVTIRGKQSEWSLPIAGKVTKQTIADWRTDGLEIIEIHNSIPTWWLLPAKIWCWIEDVFNFQNPFKKD